MLQEESEKGHKEMGRMMGSRRGCTRYDVAVRCVKWKGKPKIYK